MKRPLLLILALPSMLCAESVIKIWPEGKMPGEATTEAETEVQRNDGFTRITNVSCPTLTLFRAKRLDEKPTPAIIVCPGGGYNYTVVDKEGSEIAAWLNSAGITALVLKYRTPKNREGALQDLQRSIRLVRTRALEWSIDPGHVGVMGFSAGGHVAARASHHFENPAYSALDLTDEQSARPDFAILVYPAYLDNGKGEISPDLNLKADIPSTLIIHTEDDKSHVSGSKTLHASLERAKILHEFKLYPTGGHGYGLHCQGDAKVWPDDALRWIEDNLE